MRRISRQVLACVVVLAVATTSAQAAGANHLNAYAIQGQFFCVSCHEPLNQVNSPEANNEKATLRQLVDKGLDLQQVKADMVSYYGEAVLGEPPAHGFNLLLYVLPPVLVIAGLAFIFYNLPKWRRRSQAQALAEAAAPDGELDPSDAQRLDEELSHFDA